MIDFLVTWVVKTPSIEDWTCNGYCQSFDSNSDFRRTNRLGLSGE